VNLVFTYIVFAMCISMHTVNSKIFIYLWISRAVELREGSF